MSLKLKVSTPTSDVIIDSDDDEPSDDKVNGANTISDGKTDSKEKDDENDGDDEANGSNSEQKVAPLCFMLLPLDSASSG